MQDFLESIGALKSPVIAGFSSGNDMDEYITSIGDMQAISSWIMSKQICSVLKDGDKYTIVNGYNGINAVGYIIMKSVFDKDDRGKIIFEFKSK